VSKVIVLCGLPASGKSTWAKEQVKLGNGKVKRVNKDDLRAMIDCSEFSDSNEKFITKLRDTIIERAIEHDHDIIIDDTNIAQKHEVRIRQIIGKRADVEVKFFDVSVEECIARDAKRDNPVGEKVIRSMHQQLVKRFGNGKHDIQAFRPYERQRDLSLNPAFNPTDGLLRAIICDLDGTLALLNGRNPYDASKCFNDILNIPVADVLRTYAAHDCKVILLSGREDKYREPTEQFLNQNNIWYDELYMRSTDDFRSDVIVKREIYEQHIKDHYNVLFCLDDRKKVVSLFRDELNLTVFHVDWGNF